MPIYFGDQKVELDGTIGSVSQVIYKKSNAGVNSAFVYQKNYPVEEFMANASFMSATHKAIYVSPYIYFIGYGIYRLNISTKEVEQLKTPAQSSTYGIGLAYKDGYIYIVGGNLGKIFAYNIATNTFTQLATLSTTGPTVCRIIGNCLYAQVNSANCYKYDLETNELLTGTPNSEIRKGESGAWGIISQYNGSNHIGFVEIGGYAGGTDNARNFIIADDMETQSGTITRSIIANYERKIDKCGYAFEEYNQVNPNHGSDLYDNFYVIGGRMHLDPNERYPSYDNDKYESNIYRVRINRVGQSPVKFERTLVGTIPLPTGMLGLYNCNTCWVDNYLYIFAGNWVKDISERTELNTTIFRIRIR